MHPKIKLSHLERIAYLYLRQSSPQQLIDHQESRRVQLGLKDKLHELGFPRVEVIDCDLGKSAAGYSNRPGFGTILQNVGLSRAGAVASWEASRLARSNFDWQNLIRFCQITDTLVIDESGVYDPANSDDIAMLGIKATMSEYELSLLTKRARAGLLEKAKRGELHTLITNGYYVTAENNYEMEPDERVQQTLKLMFDQFDTRGTARQVYLWFLENQIEFPVVHHHRGGQRTITWKLPDYQIIRDALKNPAYAGAYAWGRRQTRTFIREQQPVKTAGHPVPMSEWKVLLLDHHPGYISWEKFLQNQQKLRDNSNQLSPFAKGAPKMGSSLLAGLMQCGHCGRKLAVKYSGRACPAAGQGWSERALHLLRFFQHDGAKRQMFFDRRAQAGAGDRAGSVEGHSTGGAQRGDGGGKEIASRMHRATEASRIGVGVPQGGTMKRLAASASLTRSIPRIVWCCAIFSCNTSKRWRMWNACNKSWSRKNRSSNPLMNRSDNSCTL